MQQKFAEYKKRNGDEMEALREENSRLRQKIEADKADWGAIPPPFKDGGPSSLEK